MEDTEEYQPGEQITPMEVRTLIFYGKPLVAVRLPDERPAVSIRSLCENMQLDRKAQVRRIQRTAPIAGDLVQNVMIDLGTGGGPQPSQVLVLRSLSYWLTGIDHKRVRQELQDEILKYQCEAVDTLYQWASQHPRALPAPAKEQQVVEAASTKTAIAVRESTSSVVLVPIDEPSQEATHSERAAYHELMSVWHRRQADLHAQAWRAEVDTRIEDQESRIEAREAVTDLIPEIIERLGPELISAQQQRQVQVYVDQLSKATGKHSATVHNDLKTAFERPSYRELRADEWPQVVNWFTVQIERAKKK
jgi:P22_AR N-terminal domain